MASVAASVVLVDGLRVAPGQAAISVFDRAVLHGDSIFETLFAPGGHAFALDRHLARLERAARAVELPLPVSLAVLRREVQAGLEAFGRGDARVRLTLTRGAGALGAPADPRDVRRFVIIAAAPPAPRQPHGVDAIMVRASRGLPVGYSLAKIGNYAVAALMQREAARRGAAEALYVDARDRLLQAASSNLFAVRGGALFTAPLSSGVLPGITRALVLEMAGAAAIPVHERAPRSSELSELSELFLTASVRGISPVIRVEGCAIGRGRPGPITRRLRAAWLALHRAP